MTKFVRPARVPRLRALVLEDLERFPDSSKADIWRRVGPAIPERILRCAFEDLVALDRVVASGETAKRGLGGGRFSVFGRSQRVANGHPAVSAGGPGLYGFQNGE
jgi:hypothetical protein